MISFSLLDLGIRCKEVILAHDFRELIALVEEHANKHGLSKQDIENPIMLQMIRRRMRETNEWD